MVAAHLTRNAPSENKLSQHHAGVCDPGLITRRVDDMGLPDWPKAPSSSRGATRQRDPSRSAPHLPPPPANTAFCVGKEVARAKLVSCLRGGHTWGGYRRGTQKDYLTVPTR